MNTHSPTPASHGALQWRSRDTTRHLIQGFIISCSISAVSGLLLWLRLGHDNFVQILLLTHLSAGVLCLMFALPFVITHWRDGREPGRHLIWLMPLVQRAWQREPYAGKRLIGHAFMWLLCAVLLSGLIVMAPAISYLAGMPVTLPYGSHVGLLQVHSWLSIAVLVGLCWHLPKKERT